MIIYDGLLGLLDFILLPITSLLDHYEVGDKVITLGFGSIQWFELSVNEIVKLFFVILVFWFFVRFIYFLIKTIFRIATGWIRW